MREIAAGKRFERRDQRLAVALLDRLAVGAVFGSAAVHRGHKADQRLNQAKRDSHEDKGKAIVDRVKAESMKVPVGSIYSTIQYYLGSAYINDDNASTGSPFKRISNLANLLTS